LPELGEKVAVRGVDFVEEVALKNFPSNDRVRETIVLKNIYKTILP
jgi:hypothetical protein